MFVSLWRLRNTSGTMVQNENLLNDNKEANSGQCGIFVYTNRSGQTVLEHHCAVKRTPVCIPLLAFFYKFGLNLLMSLCYKVAFLTRLGNKFVTFSMFV